MIGAGLVLPQLAANPVDHAWITIIDIAGEVVLPQQAAGNRGAH